ncbi:hypothetical protein A3Q56_05744 [Intoshia linei]|uniref:ShKT domain-containing protein n=1 Tax=Intoshia linei TaxID=1819745 RepID=A0A177AXE0_9BILA|nr:hypothetical protein A3Q56_05744 [Intoshia linei]
MTKNCQSTCKKCDNNKCKDLQKNCKDLSQYCNSGNYGKYMFEKCKLTCGQCDLDCYENLSQKLKVNGVIMNCDEMAIKGYCKYELISKLCCQTCKGY